MLLELHTLPNPEDEMVGAFGTYGRKESCVQGIGGEI